MNRHTESEGHRGATPGPDKAMNIQLAENDNDVERCFPVMAQLRPHLTAEDFMVRVKR